MTSKVIRSGFVAFFLAVLLFGSALADDIRIQPLSDGIGLDLAGRRIELHVATPHAFRLHYSLPDAAKPKPSIYLSNVPPPATPFTVTHDGSIVGIKTAFGELKVDAAHNRWSMLDAAGTTLTGWAPFQTIVSDTGKNPRFHFESGAAGTGTRPLYYGSGNDPDRGQITQSEATSKPGNGSTSLPQYWSTAGYGELLVTDNDNQPPAWRAGDLGDVTWTVSGSSVDLYLVPAPDLYAWLQAQSELTGLAPVPPLWSFGYLQSRWGWKDKAYVDDTLARFHQDNLPVDAFIFDFEWYTTTPDYDVPANGKPDFKDFGWNALLLPDPAAQLADFLKQGLHVVSIRKPRLGNSDALALARSKGWILPANPDDPNGDAIKTRNLDFAKPDVRTYYQDNNRKFIEAGMAGFWDDEGETNYTEYSYWNLAQCELFHQVSPDTRYWSLNRSFAPGLQRFGSAAWTGDISANWGDLARTPGSLLAYGLSGMPYSGCDIGGFGGNPSPEMLARWMEAGVFFPVMRAHSSIDSTPHFPWLFGPEAEDAIRQALDLRYRLIPYYYSLAFENHATGAPLMRPLIMEFPNEERLADVTDEWLMGKGLLAGPILNPGGERDVYLPKNETWYDFATNQMLAGGQLIHQKKNLAEIPIYVRAGTLLPLGPVVQNTGQLSPDPLELRIYPGHDASFTFAQDDGRSLAYQKGTARMVAFAWNDAAKTLTWKVSGSYAGPNLFHDVKARLFAPDGVMEKSAALGQDGSVTF